MKKLIAGGVAALAIAAAVPLAMATGYADRDGGGHHGMRSGHGGEHGMRGHHGEWHGGGHGGRIRMTEMIETYDADGDGSVSQAEVDEWRANRLRDFDADGSGQLSLEEYQALWLDAMRERMVDQFQAHDDDGDGQVTADEFGERTSRLVMMGDRNEDGVLNLDDIRRGRGEGTHMMRGPGGMPGGTGPGGMGHPAGMAPGGAAATPGASGAGSTPSTGSESAQPAQQ